MKFISTGKTHFVLDTIAHSLEKRKGGETKIVTLTIRHEPFDAKIAAALDQQVRVTLFKLNHPDPAPHLKAVDFSLAIPRQIVTCFASPDTVKPSIAFDQVKIAAVRARMEKGMNGFGLVVKISFGPVSKNELEYCEHWRTESRWLTWDAAEPCLDYEETEPDEDTDDEATETERPQPMFDDPRDQELVGVGADVAKHRQQHKAHTHTTKKGKRR